MNTNTTQTQATYTQLRDQTWGIRVLGTAVSGQTITITKRDGEQKSETVNRVLWTGRDSKSGQTISLCSIAPSGRNARQSRSDNAPRGRVCDYCGSRECARAWDPHDLCDED